MKKKSLIVLFLLLVSLSAYADGATCLVYHANFHLKNGKNVKGLFRVFSYGDKAMLDDQGTNPYCNDEGVTMLFKEQCGITYEQVFYPHSAFVFKKISVVQPVGTIMDCYLPAYDFVLVSDVVIVDSNMVKKITFIKVEGYKNGIYFGHSLLIQTNKIKRTIEKERYFNTTFFYEWEDGDTLVFNQQKIGSGAYFYNYNKNISIDELQQLVRTKYVTKWEDEFSKEFAKKNNIKDCYNWPPDLLEKFDREKLKKETELKKYFWKKGILVIESYIGC